MNVKASKMGFMKELECAPPTSKLTQKFKSPQNEKNPKSK